MAPRRLRSRRFWRASRRARSAIARVSDEACSTESARNCCSSSVRCGALASCHSRAVSSRAPRYSSLTGRPSDSQPSAAVVRWRRRRCPATSSSSQDCRRGQARASASWASSTVSSSEVTSRARTRSPTMRSRSASPSRLRLDTRQRTGSPSRDGVDQAQQDRAQDRSLLARAGCRRAGRRSGRRRPGCRRWPGSPRRSGRSRRGGATSRPARGTAAGGRRARPRSPAPAGRPARARGGARPARAGCSIASRSASPASGVTRCSPARRDG